MKESEKSLEHWLADPDTGLRADFNYARFTGGLNLIEAAVFSAHWRRGIGRDRLASALGLSPRQVISALARIEAALKASGRDFTHFREVENSRCPAYRELLPSGRRAWALGRLDTTWMEIIQSERKTLFAAFPTASERYPPVFGSIRPIDRGIMNLETLRTKHTDAEAKRQRIAEKTHLSRIAVEDAAADVEKLQAAMKAEQAAAILAETEWPSDALKKKLAAAQTALGTAQAAYTASKTALDRQAEIVAQVQGEVDARRREAFEAEIAPIRTTLLESMRPIAAAAVSARDIAAKYGIAPGDLSLALFPSPRPGWQNALDDLSRRNLRAVLTNAAIILGDIERAV